MLVLGWWIDAWLVQGWVLLNEYCKEPGCNLPLVKNQDGMLQCVACKTTTEGGAPPQLLQSQISQIAMSAPDQIAPYSSKPAHSPVQEYTSNVYKTSEIKPANEPLSSKSSLTLQKLDHDDASTSWNQIAEPTEALLLQKIGAARRQLAACSSVTDSAALCSLIAEAANALKAIKALEPREIERN